MTHDLVGGCFDFDGVILDSVRTGFQLVLKEYTRIGIQPLPTWKEHVLNFTPMILRYHDYTGKSRPENSIEWFDKYLDDLDLSVFPEVVEVLTRYHENGMPMRIISANKQEIVEKHCYENNIDHLFENVCGGVWNKKDTIVDFCEKHGFEREKVFMVGDSPSDMKAAKQAGAIGIGRKTVPETDVLLWEHGAHHCIDDLTDLFQFTPSILNGKTLIQ